MILNTILSYGFTTTLGILMPPSAPPFVVMICAALADNTDIIATVVTNAGIWNIDANTELNSEQAIPTTKITKIIKTNFSVLLYVTTPIVAANNVAAPRLISNVPSV